MIDWRRYVRTHLPPLEIRAERELEIVEELAQKLEAAYQAAIASGLSADEARARAEAEVPDWQALAAVLTRVEAGPATRSMPPPDAARRRVMSGFAQDLARAVRGLVRAPAYTVVSVATLALGLGLAVAAFSLIDGVLIRPLAFADADRLVLVKATVPPDGTETPELSYPDGIDLKDAGIFADFALAIPFAGTTTITDPPGRVEGLEVTPSLFSTLGVPAILGRALERADGEPASPPVAVIGYGMWQRLGAPPDIVGRVLPINEVPRTIVGVAPPGLRVDLLPIHADVFLPLQRTHPLAGSRAIRTFRGIGRLLDGASLEGASSAAATIAQRLAAQYPDTNTGRTFLVKPLQSEIVGPVRAQLVLVASLVAIVLFVAIVNLAGLVLARTTGRAREIAVRLALGAAKWRLARESIAESLVVTLTGAVLAAALAHGALAAIRSAPGLTLPRVDEAAVDGRALAALAIVAVAITCTVGLAPLLLMRQSGATSTLRTGHETAGRPALRLRAALIAGQTAFAFLLLAAATLLALNLRDVLTKPLGFETTRIVTLRISVPETRYPSREATARFYTDLLDEIRAKPTVSAAGLVSNLPLSGNTGSTLTIQGREDVPLPLRPTVGGNWASPGYFAAMGIPIVRGRDFTADDLDHTAHVTVINETLARLYFKGEDPIGQRVYFGGFGPGGPPEWHDVIGVAGDVRHRQLDADPDARAYDLFGQHWSRMVSVAIRTSDNSMEVAGRVRRLLSRRDPRLAVFAIRTAADLVSDAVAARRLLLWLVTAFAAIGLAVALVGLYGTLSYIVAQRTREVGVRMALGASTIHVSRMVVVRGMSMVAAGLAAGAIAVVAIERTIGSTLLPPTFSGPAMAIAAMTLTAAGLAACAIPAARAIRINPVDALKAE